MRLPKIICAAKISAATLLFLLNFGRDSEGTFGTIRTAFTREHYHGKGNAG